MIEISIITVGKTKEKWLDDAIDEFLKRLQPYAKIEFRIVKDDQHLLKAIEKVKSPIPLDPLGATLDSLEFSTFIMKKAVDEGSRLTFIIGGPEGLPKSLRHLRESISLSKMTFTHQMTRLILIEQIYRAFEIDKGSHYHK